MAIATSPLWFSLLGLPCHSSLLYTIFNSSRHFIAATLFVAVQQAIYRGFSFKAGPSFVELLILFWSCCRHIHFLLKKFSLGLQVAAPFFSFLVVVLLVIFTQTCCFYCYCSTSSNSHTVVLSKPASYYPVLFSIPVKRREHAYQSFIVAHGTGKVWQLCDYIELEKGDLHPTLLLPPKLQTLFFMFIML